MSWIQFSFNTTAHQEELYSNALMAAGAVSVTLEDFENNPLFEPPPDTMPLWQHIKVIGLFEANANIEVIQNILKAHLGEACILNLEITTFADQNWTRAWIDQFQPMRFGKRLMICPSWCQNPDPAAITLMLDPGLAFGTGTHATTRLCLEYLDQYPPVDKMVIDYGCGSGILGIAALKLGARFVYAIDNDPQALLSTQNNAKNNGLTEKNLITLLPESFQALLLKEVKAYKKVDRKVDLILANILANPLISLAPTFAELVTEGGIIVLSGFLENQIEAVFESYKSWFKLLETSTLDGWVSLRATRVSF